MTHSVGNQYEAQLDDDKVPQLLLHNFHPKNLLKFNLNQTRSTFRMHSSHQGRSPQAAATRTHLILTTGLAALLALGASLNTISPLKVSALSIPSSSLSERSSEDPAYSGAGRIAREPEAEEWTMLVFRRFLRPRFSALLTSFFPL